MTSTDSDLLRIDEPERMPVAGLLVGAFLREALGRPRAAAQLRQLSGDLWLRAGLMWITLRFDGQRVEVRSGRTAERRAVVEGEMDALLTAVASRTLLERGRALPDLLRRRLRVHGDPAFLIKLLPLFIAR
jgi:hypothetical protein